MREALYLVAANLLVALAFARAAGVIIGGLRSIAGRRGFRATRFGIAEALVVPEPPLLAIMTFVLLRDELDAGGASAAQTLAMCAGAALALAAAVLTIWTFRSWPGLFVGHAVAPGQGLVTDGAYGAVRHPVYAAAFLVWAGLALGFLSWPVACLLVLYVAPAYLAYMRSEETMMLAEFGDAYRRYRARVPMLFPRLRLRHRRLA